MADGFARGGVELSGDDVFEIVGFDDAMAGEGFGHDLRQFGGLRLHLAAGAADFAAVNDNGNHARRQHDHGNQREPAAVCHNNTTNTLTSDDRVADDDGGRAAQNILQRAGVVHDARDELAAWSFR